MLRQADLGFLNNIDIIMKHPYLDEDLKSIENLILNNKIIGRITLHSSKKKWVTQKL